jgi:hypothetical protein
LLGLQAFISYNVNTPGGFSLVVANSYDFFPLGTDAPICVLEIFIGRRILPTSILPVVCRVNINIKPQTIGEFGRNDSRD